jgi:hypothetical protein
MHAQLDRPETEEEATKRHMLIWERHQREKARKITPEQCRARFDSGTPFSMIMTIMVALVHVIIPAEGREDTEHILEIREAGRKPLGPRTRGQLQFQHMVYPLKRGYPIVWEKRQAVHEGVAPS